MTEPSWQKLLVNLLVDLPQELPESVRFQRLLRALRDVFACDATAILNLEGDTLVPLAVSGLSRDTLGRRFQLDQHPRLAALVAAPGPHLFPSQSPLPDPFDGLVLGMTEQLEVHDCMGYSLRVGGQPWGAITLDSLRPNHFNENHLTMLEVFGSLASATVGAVVRIRRLEQLAETEHHHAESYRRAAGEPRRRLLGNSAAFERMKRDIEVVGPSELTVLITGETGVGKELVAQELHTRSRRANRPLVSLNCAALPDTLVDSELFGHVRGAFTGALSDRKGMFELADGGTLFLDEVGELPLTVQAKLLRVLQSGQLQRLGSDREHRVDVRLIAATNRNLIEEVRAGRMRADIYHRLSVFPLLVPSLRERDRDVLPLAGFFLEENRGRLGLGAIRLDPSAETVLLAYDWPGNVRELEHLLSRSILRALGRQRERPRILSLTAGDLDLRSAIPAKLAPLYPSELVTEPDVLSDQGLAEAVHAYQQRVIQHSLNRHHGNWAAVARELRMDRANLVRLARRLGL